MHRRAEDEAYAEQCARPARARHCARPRMPRSDHITNICVFSIDLPVPGSARFLDSSILWPCHADTKYAVYQCDMISDIYQCDYTYTTRDTRPRPERLIMIMIVYCFVFNNLICFLEISWTEGRVKSAKALIIISISLMKYYWTILY